MAYIILLISTKNSTTDNISNTGLRNAIINKILGGLDENKRRGIY
jgi:hypothetical protein